MILEVENNEQKKSQFVIGKRNLGNANELTSNSQYLYSLSNVEQR